MWFSEIFFDHSVIMFSLVGIIIQIFIPIKLGVLKLPYNFDLLLPSSFTMKYRDNCMYIHMGDLCLYMYLVM